MTFTELQCIIQRNLKEILMYPENKVEKQKSFSQGKYTIEKPQAEQLMVAIALVVANKIATEIFPFSNVTLIDYTALFYYIRNQFNMQNKQKISPE